MVQSCLFVFLLASVRSERRTFSGQRRCVSERVRDHEKIRNRTQGGCEGVFALGSRNNGEKQNSQAMAVAVLHSPSTRLSSVGAAWAAQDNSRGGAMLTSGSRAKVARRALTGVAVAVAALIAGPVFAHGDRGEEQSGPKSGHPGHGAEARNMRLVGFNDLQARSAYQPLVHKQGR